MHAEHRTWFPFILIGLVVLILAAYLAWGRSVTPEYGPAPDLILEDVNAPSAEEYQAEVVTILASFEDHQDAGQTYEELLNVKVPAQYKEVHLEIVIAFGELQAGKVEVGNARLDLVTQQVDWLP